MLYRALQVLLYTNLFLYFCAFVLLYFCAFALLYFCTFALLCFCTFVLCCVLAGVLVRLGGVGLYDGGGQDTTGQFLIVHHDVRFVAGVHVHLCTCIHVDLISCIHVDLCTWYACIFSRYVYFVCFLNIFMLWIFERNKCCKLNLRLLFSC